ncbi:MAG: nucleotidyltransferase [Armatimonadetes bacterium CG_4_10_14_3_um_filter_66_18]|nr:nucleotidyltransferase family protein [Armatimonadota bacterium]OIP07979.1 MAG: nucleotidyltransferase [Armatimonadetes bacterium CG2_30_66_41]PIU93298.1 MAG: nucleotidyltransferase [Armatimonadetes bacterium CG06_land_8_20_14_3_00_66_21]PIX49711.1 MAG: nucleotidyltransferase [Armatimonadetes bacterium CG_4_8_14_3_um_filter_66_20]PIY51081.1 MAG: nucleotidyltransferase [Armatimonadetes bacterium CG_4_10_14_3_um_filter_66_18]PIZ34951.1 MAG: nucleotidyltransferase [Armatimonadetes bacterium CG
MDSRDTLVGQLQKLKPDLQREFGVREIGLFGSFARNQQNADSDVDLLVEFEPGASLLELVGLGQFLESRLLRRVDLVTRRALRDEMRARVLEEAAPV